MSENLSKVTFKRANRPTDSTLSPPTDHGQLEAAGRGGPPGERGHGEADSEEAGQAGVGEGPLGDERDEAGEPDAAGMDSLIKFILIEFEFGSVFMTF